MNYNTKAAALLVQLIDEIENDTERDEFIFFRSGLKIKLRRMRGISCTFFAHEIYQEIDKSRD